MNKNILIAILLVILVAESGYLVKKRHDTAVISDQLAVALNQAANEPKKEAAQAPKPMMLAKGAKLADSPISKFAYKIAPGDVSSETKTVMAGFGMMTAKPAADGSVVVTLTPKDSEDQNQQYTVKTGESLYFIEQTPLDDKADQDKDFNYRDDYGVIVDQNGMVQ